MHGGELGTFILEHSHQCKHIHRLNRNLTFSFMDLCMKKTTEVILWKGVSNPPDFTPQWLGKRSRF